MRLLLDTHAVLWLAAGDPRLGPAAAAAVLDPSNDVYVSIASVWEAEVKAGLGKLSFDEDIWSGLEARGARHLPVTVEHARVAWRLPPVHRDPFDRMLAAQALVGGMTLATRDAHLGRYGVPVIW